MRHGFGRLSRRVVLGLPAVAAMVLGSVGFSEAQQLTKLTLRLNYVPSGFHSPFFLGVTKVWYKEAGIDLEILDGRGSGPTINLVAAGQDDIGYTDLTALAIAKSKDIPVKAIAILIRTSGQGVIVNKGDLKKPEDFRGKEIIFNNASAAEPALFEGFLATAGMTKNDVKMIGVDTASKEASILTEKGDAAVAPLPYLQALFEGKKQIKHVMFSDFGQRLLDIGLIANDTTIKTKGPALKAFLAVTAKAYDYAIKNQSEAVDAMISMRQDAKIDKQVAINYIKYNVPMMQSPSTQGKPVGYMSKENWEEMVTNLQKVGLLPKEVKATDLYDPSFQPQ
jgi:NitT/TauT family transport system substrate-binding protein